MKSSGCSSWEICVCWGICRVCWFRLPTHHSERLLVRFIKLWSKKCGYHFRRRMRRPWVPRRKERRMRRKFPSSSDSGVWESARSSPSWVRAEPGLKRFYCNLISADRLCWHQMTSHSSLFHVWVQSPSVQKWGVPRKLRLWCWLCTLC